MTELITACPACKKPVSIRKFSHPADTPYLVCCNNSGCEWGIESPFCATESEAVVIWELAFGPKHPDVDLVTAACVMDTDGRYAIIGGNVELEDDNGPPSIDEIEAELAESCRVEASFSVHATVVRVNFRVQRPTVQEIKGEVTNV